MGTGKLSGKPDKMLGVTCDGIASHPGGVTILLVASCYGNRDKLWQLWATRLVRLNLLSIAGRQRRGARGAPDKDVTPPLLAKVQGNLEVQCKLYQLGISFSGVCQSPFRIFFFVTSICLVFEV